MGFGKKEFVLALFLFFLLLFPAFSAFQSVSIYATVNGKTNLSQIETNTPIEGVYRDSGFFITKNLENGTTLYLQSANFSGDTNPVIPSPAWIHDSATIESEETIFLSSGINCSDGWTGCVRSFAGLDNLTLYEANGDILNANGNMILNPGEGPNAYFQDYWYSWWPKPGENFTLSENLEINVSIPIFAPMEFYRNESQNLLALVLPFLPDTPSEFSSPSLLRARFTDDRDGSFIYASRSWATEPAHKARAITRNGTTAFYFTLPLDLVKSLEIPYTVSISIYTEEAESAFLSDELGGGSPKIHQAYALNQRGGNGGDAWGTIPVNVSEYIETACDLDSSVPLANGSCEIFLPEKKDYLIITTSQVKSALNSYQANFRGREMPLFDSFRMLRDADVLIVDECNSLYPNDEVRRFNCAHDLVDEKADSLGWRQGDGSKIVIIGGLADVPSSLHYDINTTSNRENKTYAYYSDMPYASKSDLTPLWAIGRIPSSGPSHYEAKTYLRVLVEEDAGKSIEWRNPSAKSSDAISIGMNYGSGKYKADLVARKLEGAGFSGGSQEQLICPDYESEKGEYVKRVFQGENESDGDFASRLSEEFNNSFSEKGLIFYDTHGSYGGLSSSTDVKTSWASTGSDLQFSSFPLVYSNGCFTGDFGSQSTWPQWMMAHGVGAYIASSAYTYSAYEPNICAAPTNRYSGRFVTQFFQEFDKNENIGVSFYYARKKYFDFFLSFWEHLLNIRYWHNMHKPTLLGFQLFGDPAFEPFVPQDPPITSYSVEIGNQTETNLTIRVSVNNYTEMENLKEGNLSYFPYIPETYTELPGGKLEQFIPFEVELKYPAENGTFDLESISLSYGNLTLSNKPYSQPIYDEESLPALNATLFHSETYRNSTGFVLHFAYNPISYNETEKTARISLETNITLRFSPREKKPIFLIDRTPINSISAGQTLSATVFIENVGENETQGNVTCTESLPPQLSANQTTFQLSPLSPGERASYRYSFSASSSVSGELLTSINTSCAYGNESFPITIFEKPSIELSLSSPSQTKWSGSSDVSIKITNTGTTPAYSLRTTSNGSVAFSDPLYPGDSAYLNYSISVSPSNESQTILLPANSTFRDLAGNSYSAGETFSITLNPLKALYWACDPTDTNYSKKACSLFNCTAITNETSVLMQKLNSSDLLVLLNLGDREDRTCDFRLSQSEEDAIVSWLETHSIIASDYSIKHNPILAKALGVKFKGTVASNRRNCNLSVETSNHYVTGDAQSLGFSETAIRDVERDGGVEIAKLVQVCESGRKGGLKTPRKEWPAIITTNNSVYISVQLDTQEDENWFGIFRRSLEWMKI